jgi:hypothetical protein
MELPMADLMPHRKPLAPSIPAWVHGRYGAIANAHKRRLASLKPVVGDLDASIERDGVDVDV